MGGSESIGPEEREEYEESKMEEIFDQTDNPQRSFNLMNQIMGGRDRLSFDAYMEENQ